MNPTIVVFVSLVWWNPTTNHLEVRINGFEMAGAHSVEACEIMADRPVFWANVEVAAQQVEDHMVSLGYERISEKARCVQWRKA